MPLPPARNQRHELSPRSPLCRQDRERPGACSPAFWATRRGGSTARGWRSGSRGHRPYASPAPAAPEGLWNSRSRRTPTRRAIEGAVAMTADPVETWSSLPPPLAASSGSPGLPRAAAFRWSTVPPWALWRQESTANGG